MRDLSYITDLIGSTINDTATMRSRGRVTQVLGTIIKAVTPQAEVGELCQLVTPHHDQILLAEVIGFHGREALLTPIGTMMGISDATEVIPTGRSHHVLVGHGMLGRILDGMGNPIDNKGALESESSYPIYGAAPNPMTRRIISEPLPLGVRAIDGLLTCGEGQRMGIFAAAGGGKSTLLSMIVKGSSADVTILALIGERGREVREFIERDLGEEGMKRSILVVATSDKSSMERAKAAWVATAIADYFRDEGLKVLFLMDSVTRFARAQREIGLSAGEPPTRRGFPPSVFAELPRLMERTGMGERGSITALYTVLVEGDDMTEPVADETRSILDGHIILSRDLAARNHYPAIDILASTSRVMTAITDKSHQHAAGTMRSMMASYKEVEMLIRIGEYQEGNDATIDTAVAHHDAIEEFLQQGVREQISFDDTLAQLQAIV